MPIDLRRKLAHRHGRGADPSRPRADGRRQRAGVPAPGAALRGRASSAPRWSPAPGSSTATRRRSAICGSPPTSIRLRSSSSARTPTTMAEAARMVEAAGADIVDVNFGCPVRKVTKTGAGATLLDDPDLACRIVAAIADAVDLPVSVKMRRGLRNGSRDCLDVGPLLVEAGAVGAHAAPALGAADVHRDGRPHAHGGARVARRRPRDRLRRHHVSRPRAGRARDDRARPP